MKVIISAVPWDMQRVKNAVRLSRETDGIIVWDEQQSIMDTFSRALLQAGWGSAVFLQDDVYLHPEWNEKVREAIADKGDSVIQFFSIRKSDLTEGSRWVPGRDYLMNQCFYLPNSYARSLYTFVQDWRKKHPEHTGDDTCLAEWLRSRKEKYWHHVPSLVQHEEWPSTLGGRSSKRQSPTFEGGAR